MQYSEYRYVDSAIGSVANRNNLRVVTEKLSGAEVYKTYFRYPEEFAEHMRKTKSVSGYHGFAYADFFPVDIDVKDNLPAALDLLRDTVEKMESRHDVNINELWYFFSGSKGFHLYIPAEMLGITPSNQISVHFKRFAKELLGPMGIKYDPEIYDAVRLWRVSNTINAKSGLHKVQLTPGEIYLDIEEIKELARAPRTVDCVRDPIANESLSALYLSVQNDNTVKMNGEPIDVSDGVPRHEKVCYHEILKGVGAGERDAACIRLAANFRNRGMPSDITESILHAWNKKNNPPMRDGEISGKIRSAYREAGKYSYGCNDQFLVEYCSDQCFLKSKAPKESPSSGDVLSYDELTRSYRQYLVEVKQSRIILPIPKLGIEMRGISPGECLYIIARAGVGKTAGLINLLQWVSRTNKEPMIFFSMEQPAPQVFERMAQVATGLGGYEIERIMRNEPAKAQWIIDTTRASFENIYVVERSGLTVDEISGIIRAAETSRIGKKVRMIGLDYMGLLSGKGKDLYQQVSAQARELQKMMKDIKTAGVVLAQINRQGEDGNKPVTMDMIRDSGSVEEVATFIIGMWKTKEVDMIKMQILKNRHGVSGAVVMMDFLKPSLRFDDLEKTLWADKMIMAEQFGQEVPLI
jgi:hypothetical protein